MRIVSRVRNAVRAAARSAALCGVIGTAGTLGVVGNIGITGSALGADAPDAATKLGHVATFTLADGRELHFTMPIASDGTQRETLGFDQLEDGTLVQYVLVTGAKEQSIDVVKYAFDAAGHITLAGRVGGGLGRDGGGVVGAPPCPIQGPPYCWEVDEPPTYEIDPHTGRTLRCVLYYTVCQDPCGNITESGHHVECTPLRRPRQRNPAPPIDVASAS